MSARPELGAIVEATVASAHPFGVFVRVDDWPEAKALIRIADYESDDAIAPILGQRVSARVIEIDERNEEVILTRRDVPATPFVETWWLRDEELPYKLEWARLRTWRDGTAEIFEARGRSGFASEETARRWLSEGDFEPFGFELQREYDEIPWTDVRVPTASDDAALAPKMLVTLEERVVRDAHAELRAHGQPEWNLGFEAVTVHPLADDTATLARLGLEPDQCKVCDLYWVREDVLHFVSIGSTVAVERSTPGASLHGRPARPFGSSFNVRTRAYPITSTVVRGVLKELDAWIRSNPDQVRVDRPEEVVRVAEQDLIPG